MLNGLNMLMHASLACWALLSIIKHLSFLSVLFRNFLKKHLSLPTGNGLEGALELHLVDAMVGGLAVGAALGDGLLTGTAADAHAVNDESLLGAVSLSPEK